MSNVKKDLAEQELEKRKQEKALVAIYTDSIIYNLYHYVY